MTRHRHRQGVVGVRRSLVDGHRVHHRRVVRHGRLEGVAEDPSGVALRAHVLGGPGGVTDGRSEALVQSVAGKQSGRRRDLLLHRSLDLSLRTYGAPDPNFFDIALEEAGGAAVLPQSGTNRGDRLRGAGWRDGRSQVELFIELAVQIQPPGLAIVGNSTMVPDIAGDHGPASHRVVERRIGSGRTFLEVSHELTAGLVDPEDVVDVTCRVGVDVGAALRDQGHDVSDATGSAVGAHTGPRLLEPELEGELRRLQIRAVGSPDVLARAVEPRCGVGERIRRVADLTRSARLIARGVLGRHHVEVRSAGRAGRVVVLRGDQRSTAVERRADGAHRARGAPVDVVAGQVTLAVVVPVRGRCYLHRTSRQDHSVRREPKRHRRVQGLRRPMTERWRLVVPFRSRLARCCHRPRYRFPR